MKRLLLPLFTFAALLTWMPAWAQVSTKADINSPVFQRMERKFQCVDGCGMALEDCSNSTAQQMRSDLLRMIDEGQSETAISTYMVSIYGLEVLREPPREGFNLLVWILPFSLIVFGGVVVFFAVNRWVFSRDIRRAGSAQTIHTPDDDIYDEMIERERKSLL